MSATRILPDTLGNLDSMFSGALLTADDAGYDEHRRVHNGLIDRRPAVIARCLSTADAAAAVRFAREHGLEVAVRGGGHNVAGRATIDDGILIDLSPMKTVEVDPERRIAVAAGGATWAVFNEATQRHGLATTGGAISSTGVGGLTLGGGWGWLQGKYGLSLDNLLGVEMVLADGSVVKASDEQNPDLFWAVRGAGANFGVVTSLTFRLHPVGPTVVGGLVAHPFDRAGDVLRFYRDHVRDLPDELTLAAGVLHAGDGSGTKLVAILAGWCGSVADGEAAVRPLKEFGKPVMDALGPMQYSELNQMLDGGFPRGALNYWKSTFVRDISDETIDTIVEVFADCPTPMSGMLFERWHGAMRRVPPSATAYGLRDLGDNLLIVSEWMDPAQTNSGIAWARDAYAALASFRAAGGYLNYLGDDSTPDEVAAAYGPNLPRLRELKAKYDPENFFHMNQNIRPNA